MELDGAKERAVISRALQSAFYKEKLKSHAMASIQELPFTSKSELGGLDKKETITSTSRKSLHYHESSGSSGQESYAWYTRDDIIANAKSILSRGINLEQSDYVLIRFPFSLSLPAYFIQEAVYQAGATLIPASSRNTIATYPKVLSLLDELEITVFAGLPRELELLAETAKMTNANFAKIKRNMKLLVISGELVTEKRKQYIEQLWETPVQVMYGMTELGNIATTCEFGYLHFDANDFYVEVFDFELQEQKTFGEKGIAVISSLYQEGSTKLRFVTNDIVSIHDQCSCGATNVIDVHGRMSERINVDGNVYDSADIQSLIYGMRQVPFAWKLECTDEKFMFYLQYEDMNGIDEQEIISYLKKQFPSSVQVDVHFDKLLFDTNTLTETTVSMKPKYIEKIEGKLAQAT
ncbi:phenylacetate--CoA ligase family protein [Metabacillus malikii]|uniref:Phenylacetate-CoA ligase n=1 Tax=Metabacillus malikii TaxID=1504265 RepID=A0ABT9Z9X4_9BACI|nr:AMP-binding protein [Metabacillus malikii]MDQ0229061.1 phenylacetate-CoA ligase [Metabacillus malikii]